MIKAGKCWGLTQEIFRHNNVSIHRIEVKKGGYCSTHKHLYKFNMFYVEQGRLRVKVWKKDYDLCDETVIGPGEATTAEPEERHMFLALEDTVAFEIYYTENLDSDIVRENCGGNQT